MTTPWKPLSLDECRDLTCMLAGAPWPDAMLPELQRLLAIYDGLLANDQRPVDPATPPRKDAKEVMRTGGLPASPQPAEVPEPSPTSGMNIAQRIAHVGGRNNAAGYVEFGSIQAVEALVRQVLRDLPVPPQPEAEKLRKALVYVAFALHDTPQYMLAPGITLIDGDTVRVSRDGWTVEASTDPRRQPSAPAPRPAP